MAWLPGQSLQVMGQSPFLCRARLSSLLCLTVWAEGGKGGGWGHARPFLSARGMWPVDSHMRGGVAALQVGCRPPHTSCQLRAVTSGGCSSGADTTRAARGRQEFDHTGFTLGTRTL